MARATTAADSKECWTRAATCVSRAVRFCLFFGVCGSWRKSFRSSSVSPCSFHFSREKGPNQGLLTPVVKDQHVAVSGTDGRPHARETPDRLATLDMFFDRVPSHLPLASDLTPGFDLRRPES